MTDIMSSINEALPSECNGHAERSECAECHKAFKVAAALASNNGTHLSPTDAVEASLDFVSSEMKCEGAKKISASLAGRRVIAIQPVED